VSFWHYDAFSIQRRNDTGKNEEWYCGEKNKGLHEHFDILVDIPCVFIDSYTYFDDKTQKEAFDRESTKLWNIINTTEPFEFKSFQDILEELEEAKEENKRLHDVIDDDIAELWDAMDKNTGDIFKNTMTIDENAESIEQVHSETKTSLDELSQSLNDTTDILLAADKDLTQSLNETAKMLITADEALSGKRIQIYRSSLFP